jgi:hypothetical protein
MATFRHSSAMILRRIGLTSMMADGQELPPYFDPHYNCQMEVLRFDSRQPNPKYAALVSEISELLAVAPVVVGEFPKSRGDGSLIESATVLPPPI